MSEEYEYEYESESFEEESVEDMDIPLVPSAEELKKSQDRSGVVYIGSIPRGMTPTELRQLLQPLGVVNRLYLEPAKNKFYHGKQVYKEGWIEFEDGELAESLVEAINLKPMTQRRKSPYHAHHWLLRFLPGFKWGDFSEAKTVKSKTRAERIKERLVASRQEAQFYRKTVSKSK